jgi:hypothetical protein
MKRLLRRSGVLLASLGLAVGALLVAPVSNTAPPAQADHITLYDNNDYLFHKSGSWWAAQALNCFTTNLEYLQRLTIWNLGSQGHKFRWKWQTYAGTVAYEQTTWVWIFPGNSWTWAPPEGSTFGALNQSGHPRVKIYWVNASGQAEVLWELHAWDPDAYTWRKPGPVDNNGDCSI